MRHHPTLPTAHMRITRIYARTYDDGEYRIQYTYMCIPTVVQVRKRTSHGPVYLVPHDTVIPPGDGSQNIPWCTTVVEVEAQAIHAASATTTFIPYYLTRETGTRIHPYLVVRGEGTVLQYVACRRDFSCLALRGIALILLYSCFV